MQRLYQFWTVFFAHGRTLGYAMISVGANKQFLGAAMFLMNITFILSTYGNHVQLTIWWMGKYCRTFCPCPQCYHCHISSLNDIAEEDICKGDATVCCLPHLLYGNSSVENNCTRCQLIFICPQHCHFVGHFKILGLSSVMSADTYHYLHIPAYAWHYFPLYPLISFQIRNEYCAKRAAAPTWLIILISENASGSHISQ